MEEEQPPFFIPARYKLLLKCYQDLRNANRFSRKPMPDKVRQEYITRSKEYNMYKHLEVQRLEQEAALQTKAHWDALLACEFLPDYLHDEAFTETEEDLYDDGHEFAPSTLYLEQVLRIFPKEYTNKLRMLPAYDETLMKFEEQGDKQVVEEVEEEPEKRQREEVEEEEPKAAPAKK